MVNTLRRTLEDGSPAIARTLPEDQPFGLGLDTDRISGRVLMRHGPNGTSELWNRIEDAMPADEYGWRSIDDDDGCAYLLGPNGAGGLTLFDGFEMGERTTA
ncbi:MAG: hypothetical protein ACREMD_13900 [Gemmatimonadota bacterium]